VKATSCGPATRARARTRARAVEMIVTVFEGGELTATQRPSGDASRLCGPLATGICLTRRHGGSSSTVTTPARSAATKIRYLRGRWVGDCFAIAERELEAGLEPGCAVDGTRLADPPQAAAIIAPPRHAMHHHRMPRV
jgi:hypothetical protein